jgi:hypothetical protein
MSLSVVAKLQLPIIILVCIVFTAVCIFIYRMIISKPIIKKRKKSIFDLEDFDNFSNLDTGDLVFVAYKNTLGYFMRGWMGSAWTHVGMIMKYENKLYVMETADYSSSNLVKDFSKNNGVLVIPFETWKSLNKKHVITCRKLQTPEDFDRRVLIREFLNIQEANLDTFQTGGCNLHLWNKHIWKKSFDSSSKNDSNITCSELIAKIYQSGAVIKKKYDPGSYYTKDFIEDAIEMEYGFKLI